MIIIVKISEFENLNISIVLFRISDFSPELLVVNDNVISKKHVIT